ncbi:MAG: protein kinase [Kofleriaceae bacterium]
MNAAFGKYTLLRKVGAGGMAEVFLARTAVAQGLAKTLVLKKIHPAYARSRQFVTMFVDEAKIALGLNHPNIVQVFDFGAVDDTYFLAMEHVEGLDLLRLLQDCAAQRRRIPYGLSCYVVQQVAKGLDYAHRKADEFGDPLGIVHRDISPQNVLLSWDGAVKIVDFGIARARDVHEEEGVIKGKFAYMSPEQARGEPVDCRSDVFAAGIVLYELVCARPLFTGKGKEALEMVKAGAIPPPRQYAPELPETLEKTILRALAFDRNDRYATARDLQSDLGRSMLEWGQRTGELADSSLLAQFLSTVVPAERRVPTLRPPSEPVRPAPSASASLPELATPRPAATPRPIAGAGPQTSGVVAGAAGPQLSVDPSGPLRAPEPSVREGARERRYVYVLDGVLRGIAALERRVGGDGAARLLGDFAHIARDVAFKHDALLVEPPAGDEAPPRDAIRLVVGLPLASEDDADRVVRLGLALIDALDGVGADVEPELRLGVGIQRGVARVARGGAGAAELEDATAAFASRLARQAAGGEILVGGRVFRAARAEWVFEELPAIDVPIEFEGAGGLRVDDETDPGLRRIRVYRLGGAKERTQRLRERARARGHLLGRELELKALRDAYRDVVLTRSKRQLTLVGDAGVGKRTLVNAFLDGLPAGEAIGARHHPSPPR